MPRTSAVVAATLARQPQEVTRRGKPAVVVLASDEYHRLLKAVGGCESFAAHLLAFPGGELGEIERAKVQPRDVAF